MLGHIPLHVDTEQGQRLKDLPHCVFRFRWLVALVVFCVCVGLRIHGSSIGVYNEVFPTQVEPERTTLVGRPRWIRSDEFGVQTPTFFSQQYNQHQLYSRQMGVSPANMVLDYYSPVWDWTVLGKPLLWGYLLFGNEVGLSWYWCGELILIGMCALELFLILLGGRQLESVLGAVMVVLSPEVQWWVLPHLPIVTMYAMGLFCLGYHFFTARTARAKWGISVLTSIALVGFALSIYPSYQVPFAYITIALLAVCLARDRNRVVVLRLDWTRLLLSLAAAAAILVHFAVTSWDDLQLLLNTSYPGTSFNTGGNKSVGDLFFNIACLYSPFTDIDIPGLNNCEAATFLHVAPFFLVLSPRMLATLKRNKDKSAIVGKVLLGILAVEVLYMLVGIPREVASVTFLRYCNRMHGIYDWTATVFSVWGFSVLLRNPRMLRTSEKLALPIGYAIVAGMLVSGPVKTYLESIQVRGISAPWMLAGCALVGFAVMLLLATFYKVKLFSAVVIALMLCVGATVNPVERGTGALTNHPISKAIAQTSSSEPNERWLCTDCIFFLSNFVMSNGARVLDATNFYPDVEKWSVIDPDGTFREETNRYANQQATLTEESSSVELLNPDLIQIRLNPNDLKKLGIRYLFSSKDYATLLARYNITCEPIAKQDGYGIYRLSY